MWAVPNALPNAFQNTLPIPNLCRSVRLPNTAMYTLESEHHAVTQHDVHMCRRNLGCIMFAGPLLLAARSPQHPHALHDSLGQGPGQGMPCGCPHETYTCTAVGSTATSGRAQVGHPCNATWSSPWTFPATGRPALASVFLACLPNRCLPALPTSHLAMCSVSYADARCGSSGTSVKEPFLVKTVGVYFLLRSVAGAFDRMSLFGHCTRAADRDRPSCLQLSRPNNHSLNTAKRVMALI